MLDSNAKFRGMKEIYNDIYKLKFQFLNLLFMEVCNLLMQCFSKC